MSHLTANILVFDSGVGGLSIVQHIRQQLPAAAVTYLADNRLFPYGLMEEKPLIERVTSLICAAVDIYRPDIIVIACNTASTLTLPYLRQSLQTPIVGVVPAIKPAAQLSKNKVVGLLATPGTIRREYTDDLIEDFATGCEIIRLGTSRLVVIVEEMLSGIIHPRTTFSEILKPFADHPRWREMDTMVLACTHFPLAVQQLSQAAPGISQWVDSGLAIAKRVKSLLFEIQTAGEPVSHQQTRHNIALFTKIETLPTPLKRSLQDYGFSQITGFE